MLEQSTEQEATCEADVSIGSVEIISNEISKAYSRPPQPYKSTNSPTKFLIAAKVMSSPKDSHFSKLHRSVKVDKTLDQSLLSLSKDEHKYKPSPPKLPHQNATGKFTHNVKSNNKHSKYRHELKTDALKLADLEVTGVKKN